MPTTTKTARFLHFDFKPSIAEAQVLLADLEESLEEKTQLLLGIEEVARHDVKERFETETDASGSAWPDWSDSYAKRAASINTGKLQQTNALVKAATSVESFLIEGPRLYFNFGNLPHYGQAHEEGLPNRKAPLPQRSFTPFSDDAAVQALGIGAGWLDNNVAIFTNRWNTTQIQRRGAGGLFSRKVF